MSARGSSHGPPRRMTRFAGSRAGRRPARRSGAMIPYRSAQAVSGDTLIRREGDTQIRAPPGDHPIASFPRAQRGEEQGACRHGDAYDHQDPHLQGCLQSGHRPPARNLARAVRYQRRRPEAGGEDGRARQQSLAARYRAAIDHWLGQQAKEAKEAGLKLVALRDWLDQGHGYGGSLRSVQRFVGGDLSGASAPCPSADRDATGRPGPVRLGADARPLAVRRVKSRRDARNRSRCD